MSKPKYSWGWAETIALISLIVALISLIVALANPELRQLFRLSKKPEPEPGDKYTLEDSEIDLERPLDVELLEVEKFEDLQDGIYRIFLPTSEYVRGEVIGLPELMGLTNAEVIFESTGQDLERVSEFIGVVAGNGPEDQITCWHGIPFLSLFPAERGDELTISGTVDIVLTDSGSSPQEISREDNLDVVAAFPYEDGEARGTFRIEKFLDAETTDIAGLEECISIHSANPIG